MTQKKRRVFLVDDHPIVRQGLALLINQEPDLTVCGTAPDTLTAMKSIPGADPEIVVTDISMPGPDGMELVKDLVARLPSLPILVLSIHDEMLYAERALKAGARGYMMKHEVESTIMAGIRRILKGDIYVSPGMTKRLLNKASDRVANTPASSMELLSDRELHIFEMLGRGKGSVEIAGELQIGIKTVETHIIRIRRKLNLGTTRELIRAAILWVQQKSNS